MFWLGFGIYTMFMVFVFWFFVVAKIHIYKFRHYGVNIEPVTKTLAIVLLVLAFVGYYLLFSGDVSAPRQTVEETENIEIY